MSLLPVQWPWWTPVANSRPPVSDTSGCPPCPWYVQYIRSKRSFTLLLLACGDVHSNPGPGSATPCECPCAVCDVEVSDDQHGLFCEVCCNWSHRTCVRCLRPITFTRPQLTMGGFAPAVKQKSFPFMMFPNFLTPIVLTASS